MRFRIRLPHVAYMGSALLGVHRTTLNHTDGHPRPSVAMVGQVEGKFVHKNYDFLIMHNPSHLYVVNGTCALSIAIDFGRIIQINLQQKPSCQVQLYTSRVSTICGTAIRRSSILAVPADLDRSQYIPKTIRSR